VGRRSGRRALAAPAPIEEVNSTREFDRLTFL
jgi:hypothetical protein